MTLPDPLRGYAAPTWDTRTLKTLIDSLGGPGATPANLYAPSAKVHFCDAYMDGAGANKQTLPYASPTTLNLDTEATDTNNNFDTGTHFYTCPVTGIYLCQGIIRPVDNAVTTAGGVNLGLGIHPSNDVADSSFAWNKVQATNTGAGRSAIDYQRIGAFTSGAQLRFYAFYDSATGSGTLNITSARMQIWRVG